MERISSELKKEVEDEVGKRIVEVIKGKLEGVVRRIA